MNGITVERVRDVLDYCPASGAFTWKIRLSNRVRIGDVAGCADLHGYILIGICGRTYKAHRLAFAFMEGRFPHDQVDHINGNPADNRWANLREVPESINQENKRCPKAGSKTGVLGVAPKRGKFAAYIGVRGRTIYLGTFDTADAAHERYIAAKREMHLGCTL